MKPLLLMRTRGLTGPFFGRHAGNRSSHPLAHSKGSYLSGPGGIFDEVNLEIVTTIGSGMSTPIYAGLTPSGNDLEIIMHLRRSDWSTTNMDLHRVDTQGTLRVGWLFQIREFGSLHLQSQGVDTFPQGLGTSTANVPFANGETGWIRATGTVANGINFYTSPDPFESWTQLGAADLDDWPTSGFTGMVDPVSVGARSAGFFGGPQDIYSCRVYDGIDGPLLMDFDPPVSAVGQSSFVDSLGQTWTIHGTGISIIQDP